MVDYEKLSKKLLFPSDRKVYIEFMKRRFPQEHSEAYAGEWVDRFNTGRPENYMDRHSKEVYFKVLNERDKAMRKQLRK